MRGIALGTTFNLSVFQRWADRRTLDPGEQELALALLEIRRKLLQSAELMDSGAVSDDAIRRVFENEARDFQAQLVRETAGRPGRPKKA